MIANNQLLALINSPVRQITARVELYNGSTLAATYSYNDALVSIDVERAGESKFFGFGVCQKLNVKLRDINRSINITTANSLKVYFNDLCAFPVFYVTEVHRNENTNQLSITAYDAIYAAYKHTVDELTVATPYTIRQFANACGSLLGLTVNVVGVGSTETCFNTSYETGANFEGTETIREALNAIAEATQTVFYIDYTNKLVFKRLDKSGAAVLTIDKEKYITLESGDNRRLGVICSTNELGDSTTTATTATGSTQFVRNNPFWELREDIATLLDNAIAAVGGFTINQFDCNWRGNFLLEVGDKIALTTKNNGTVTSYVLNDSISYDGTLSQDTQWEYKDNETETAANPTMLGEALKQTYAKVDKVNKQIELVASESSANAEAIATLQINTDNISASVSDMQTTTTEALESVNGELATLTSRVDASITSEDVQLQIQTELSNGVDKVTTSTGFTFNEEGLTVAKSGSEMTTTITEDGMVVYRDNTAVLTANHDGVDAVNLHATT